MQASIQERALQIIGQDNLNKLEAEGITLAPKIRPPTYNRYSEGERTPIGTCIWLEDNQAYPYIDQDPNGYELLLSSYQGYIFTIWVGKANTKPLSE